MSDDEGDNAIRRSPRKGADGGPVMPADAARNILRKKTEAKGTKRDPPDKTTGGSKAGNRKKQKTTTITEAVATLPEEDDADNFELDSQTEAEAKKFLDAKKLLEAKKLLDAQKLLDA